MSDTFDVEERAFWDAVFLQIHDWEFMDREASARWADEALAERRKRFPRPPAYREMSVEEANQMLHRE